MNLPDAFTWHIVCRGASVHGLNFRTLRQAPPPAPAVVQPAAAPRKQRAGREQVSAYDVEALNEPSGDGGGGEEMSFEELRAAHMQRIQRVAADAAAPRDAPPIMPDGCASSGCAAASSDPAAPGPPQGDSPTCAAAAAAAADSQAAEPQAQNVWRQLGREALAHSADSNRASPPASSQPRASPAPEAGEPSCSPAAATAGAAPVAQTAGDTGAMQPALAQAPAAAPSPPHAAAASAPLQLVTEPAAASPAASAAAQQPAAAADVENLPPAAACSPAAAAASPAKRKRGGGLAPRPAGLHLRTTQPALHSPAAAGVGPAASLATAATPAASTAPAAGSLSSPAAAASPAAASPGGEFEDVFAGAFSGSVLDQQPAPLEPTVTISTREAWAAINGMFSSALPHEAAPVTGAVAAPRPPLPRRSSVGGAGARRQGSGPLGGGSGLSRRSSILPSAFTQPIVIREDKQYGSFGIGGRAPGLGGGATFHGSGSASFGGSGGDVPSAEETGPLPMYEDTQFLSGPVSGGDSFGGGVFAGGGFGGGSAADETGGLLVREDTCFLPPAATEAEATGGLGLYEDTQFLTGPVAAPALQLAPQAAFGTPAAAEEVIFFLFFLPILCAHWP